MQSEGSVRFLNRRTPPHLVTLIAMAGLTASSMNIFLPSLPGIAEWFAVEYGVALLAVAVYLCGNAVLQLFVGPVSDYFGRRPVVLSCVAVFMLATLGCIYAGSITIFLLCRALQTTIIVGIVLSRAIARDLKPDPGEAASLIAYITVGMGIIQMLAPMLGGFLEGAFDWRANFWALFAGGALVFTLVFFDHGESVSRRIGTVSRQYKGYRIVLRSSRFWAYALAQACCAGAFFAYLGGAPLVGTREFHLSPEQLGMLLGAVGFGYVLGNYLSGRLSVSMGGIRMILAGSVLAFLAVFASIMLFLAGYGSAYSFFGLMTFVGIGNGMTMPNATAGMVSVFPRLAGTASGIGGAAAWGGGGLLSALAGTSWIAGSGLYALLSLILTITTVGLFAILWVMLIRERHPVH